MNKSVFGLNENLAAALAYLGVFITGIIVLVMERENKFVRFAALQSTVFFLITWALGAIINWLPIIGWLVGWVVPAIAFIGWICLTFMAYKGQAFKIPILGDICWEQVHK